MYGKKILLQINLGFNKLLATNNQYILTEFLNKKCYFGIKLTHEISF